MFKHIILSKCTINLGKFLTHLLNIRKAAPPDVTIFKPLHAIICIRKVDETFIPKHTSADSSSVRYTHTKLVNNLVVTNLVFWWSLIISTNNRSSTITKPASPKQLSHRSKRMPRSYRSNKSLRPGQQRTYKPPPPTTNLHPPPPPPPPPTPPPHLQLQPTYLSFHTTKSLKPRKT